MVLGEALYKASQEGAQEDTSSEIENESSKVDTADAVDVDFEEDDEDQNKKKK